LGISGKPKPNEKILLFFRLSSGNQLKNPTFKILELRNQTSTKHWYLFTVEASLRQLLGYDTMVQKYFLPRDGFPLKFAKTAQ
jgi:hypothetical protein